MHVVMMNEVCFSQRDVRDIALDHASSSVPVSESALGQESQTRFNTSELANQNCLKYKQLCLEQSLHPFSTITQNQHY